MPTLKKLETDNLRDAIVEVRYESHFDFSILKGLLYDAFKDKGELLSDVSPVSIHITGQPEIQFPRAESLDFVKGPLKFSFSAGRIHFNIVSDYPGWAAYFPIVESVLSDFADLRVVTGVAQIGLRYISDHRGKTIDEVSSLLISFPGTEQEVWQQSHRFEIQSGTDVVTVVVTDTLVPAKGAQPLRQAVVDIDVIHRFSTPSSALAEWLSAVRNLHDKEKSFFVKVMNPSYLTSLKAEFN